LRLSECIKHLSECYVEVCPNQDVGFKILQTAMQSEVVFLITNYQYYVIIFTFVIYIFQANNFIKKFHTEKINKLQLLLDSENWRQKVVPSEFQHLVEYIQTTGIYVFNYL